MEGMECPICFDPLHTYYFLNNCHHMLCRTCGDNWLAMKRFCPLCTSEVASIVCNEGKPVNLPELETDCVTKEETFECLDHHYFGEQIPKFTSHFSFLKKSLASNSKGKCAQEELKWKIVQGVDYKLEEIVRIINTFTPFSPSEMISTISEIQSTISKATLNNWNEIPEFQMLMNSRFQEEDSAGLDRFVVSFKSLKKGKKGKRGSK